MSEERIDNETEEREEKGGRRSSLGWIVFLCFNVLLALGLSFFIAKDSLNYFSRYYLIALWAIELVYALNVASLIGFKRLLSWALMAVVIGCCVYSLGLRLNFFRPVGWAPQAICAEEAAESDSCEEYAEDVSPEEESGNVSGEENEESVSESKEKEVPEWEKHYAHKYEDDISVTKKGAFSLYTYSFSGEGKEHTKEEIEKYDISYPFNSSVYYSEVESKVSIEWPELESGLTPAALAKVRRTILWMAFSQVVPFGFIPYDRLKGLGETKESILKYLDIIDTNEWDYLDHYITESAEDGEISKSGNFCLAGFLRSHFVGKLPAKEGDEVGDDCLMASLAFAKQYVNECYECKLESGHQCSRYDFTAQIDLSWPFGLKAKEGAKWYEQPVMCLKYWGYANDGGNGDHSDNDLKIYRLPDGEELSFEDYFASDKLKALEALVKQRLISDWINNDEDGKAELERNGFYLDDIKISEKGMLFKWPVYAILSRPWASPEVFIEWKDLEPFMNNEQASRQDNNKNVDN